MDFSVVIPVVQKHFLLSLLDNIQCNTVRPIEILIIDNGGGVAESVCAQFPELPIRYLKQPHNIGVNASWNLGLKESRCSIVSVLNDDLVLPITFFDSLTKAFCMRPSSGLIVPNTIGPTLSNGNTPPWPVGRPSDIQPCYDAPVLQPLVRREGWAFTIKKGLVDPIPSSLFTFCGDDYWFRQVNSRGYRTYKILNNTVFHYVGVSQDLKARDVLGLPTLQQDREAWAALGFR